MIRMLRIWRMALSYMSALEIVHQDTESVFLSDAPRSRVLPSYRHELASL